MGYDHYVRGVKHPAWNSSDGTLNEEVLSPKYYLRRSIGGQPALREMLLRTGAAHEGYVWHNSWMEWGMAFGSAKEKEALAVDIQLSKAMAQVPEFPEHPGEEHFEYDEDWVPRPVTEIGAQFLKENDAVLEWRPEGSVGIPIHKLSDNSGWIVTKQECVEALSALITHTKIAAVTDTYDADNIIAVAEEHMQAIIDRLETEFDDEFGDVVEFLISGATHDGFTVN